jgi:hypothetical protein
LQFAFDSATLGEGKNMEQTKPLFEVGEVAILQPPHPSAKAYWGMETTILRRVWASNSTDAYSKNYSGWDYQTDIQAPPPTNRLIDQHNGWIWCEYDLRKKLEAGDDFKTLIKGLKSPADVTAIEYAHEMEKA